MTISPIVNSVYTATFMPAPGPAVYVVKEATNPEFTCNARTFTTTVPYMVFDKSSQYQTWYYHVRAYGSSWGQTPDWSDVVSASTGYYDDFSCDDSGWPEDKVWVYYSQSTGQNRYWYRDYHNDDSRIYIDSGGPKMWFIQPTGFAPYRPSTDKFCLEAKVKFYDWGFWDNAGVIFGASEGGSEFYVVSFAYANKELGWGLQHKKNYEFPKKALFGATVYAGEDKTSHLDYNEWNKVQVSVDGEDVTSLYLNGHSKLSEPINMPGLDDMVKVGFFAGVYEITPMDWRVQYFRVKPGEECTP
jgi:hypothetical protein